MNYLFEDPEATIKRITSETEEDSRYDDVEEETIKKVSLTRLATNVETETRFEDIPKTEVLHYVDISDDSFDEESIATKLPIAAEKLGIKVELVDNAKTRQRQWPTFRFTGQRDAVIAFLKERAHPHGKSLFHELKKK